MAESYTVEAKLIADIANYTRGIQQATQQMQGFENKANSSSAGVQKSTSGWGDATQRAAQTVGKGMMIAGAATTAMGVKSLKSFGDFETGLNQAAIIAGGTSKDIQGLSEVALKMGQDLPISANDASDAMVEMARNGASVGEIKEQFPAIAKAATAAGADLKTTAGVVQQAMNVWGDSLESPQQAAALLTQSANLSNASIESMQEALATMGPVASSSGMSLSETSTAIGLLTNTGMSSAQAAQDLRHALLQMQAPSKKAADEFDRLGININDTSGKMRPFPDILKDVSKATSGMGDSEKKAALKTMFHTSGMQAMLPLLNSINDTSGDAKTSWAAYSSEMDKVGKNTQTANAYLNQQANDMQNNIGSKIEQVGGSWDSLSKKSMIGAEDTNKSMLTMTAQALNWANDSDSSVASVIRSFIGLSPVIGPAMTIAGKSLTNFNTIVTGTKNVASLVLGPLKAVGNTASGLVGHFTNSGKAAKSSSTSLQQVTTASNGASGSAQKAGSAFGGFSGAVLKVGVGVGVATAGIGAMAFGIAALAQTGTQGVIAVTAVSVAIIAVTGALTLMAPILTANTAGLFALSGVFFSLSAVMLSVSVAFLSFGAMVTMIGAGILMATTGISRMIMAFIQLTTVMNQIVPTFAAIGTGAAMMMVSFLTAIIGNMPIIIQGMVSIMNGMLTAVSTTAPRIITTVLNMMLQFLQAIANKIGPIASTAIQIMIGFLNAIASKIGAVINAATNVIVNFLNGLNRNIPRIIPAAVRVIVTFINGIANNLHRIINAGINLMFKFINGIVNKIPEMATRAREAVMRFAYGVGNAIGQLLGSGHQLMNMFIQGIRDGFNNARNSGEGAGHQVGNGIGVVSLFNNGRAILSGFLSGLHSMWNSIKSFVSGIGPWIKAHKGPISYDKKLLVPAGTAIMDGLNSGLENNFSTVKNTVSSMAQGIEDAFGKSALTSDIALTSTSDNLNIGASGALGVSLNDTNFSQPAYINLEMGDNTYSGFAENINQTNGNNIRLSSRYRI